MTGIAHNAPILAGLVLTDRKCASRNKRRKNNRTRKFFIAIVAVVALIALIGIAGEITDTEKVRAECIDNHWGRATFLGENGDYYGCETQQDVLVGETVELRVFLENNTVLGIRKLTK